MPAQASRLVPCVSVAVSLVMAATISELLIASSGRSSERRTKSNKRTRNLWIMASISTATVIRVKRCALMNRSSAMMNAAAAQ